MEYLDSVIFLKQFVFRDRDPGGVYFLASLIMGSAFAALSAGMSDQEDAHKTVGRHWFSHIPFIRLKFR
jgi:hypothetical protein